MIKSQNGLSMLEMSISMGVLGGVMLISMNVVNQQKSNESYITSKGEIQKAISLMAINLKNPENCRNVVAGRKYQKTPSAETKLSTVRIKVNKTKSLITNCTVTGANLPSGLQIDPKTCLIYGTPQAPSDSQTYTLNVTYGNSTTPLTSTFSLYVEDLAQNQNNTIGRPTLSFDGAQGTRGKVGDKINISPTKRKFEPTYTGSDLTSATLKKYTDKKTCTISPPLPEGLEFNEETCAISGKIPLNTITQTYKITATNDFGSVSENVTLMIGNTQNSASDSGKSANYKGVVSRYFKITPVMPSPVTSSTSSPDEMMEIIKPDTRYKDFKTESIEVLQQDTNANNVVDLQVKFRVRNRDARKWNAFNISSNDDIIITEKIPLIISRDSTNTITDCTAAVGESTAAAKEKFCKSLGVAASWDSTNKKCSFSSDAKCPTGKILRKMEGMKVVCEDIKDHIDLNDLFDQSKCSSTGSFRNIESNGKLKIDCNNAVLITQRTPNRGGALPVSQNITMEFDIELDISTVTTQNVGLYLETLDANKAPTYTLIPSVVSYSNKKITINPNDDLVAGKTYKIELNGNVKSTGQPQKSIHGIKDGESEFWTFVAQ